MIIKKAAFALTTPPVIEILTSPLGIRRSKRNLSSKIDYAALAGKRPKRGDRKSSHPSKCHQFTRIAWKGSRKHPHFAKTSRRPMRCYVNLRHGRSYPSPLLRAADGYAYTGCGSTAYCYLFYLGDEQILIHIGKSCRSSACLVRIAGPCPAVPFQLVPVQLRYTNVRVYECTSVRTCPIATETRPARNTKYVLAGWTTICVEVKYLEREGPKGCTAGITQGLDVEGEKAGCLTLVKETNLRTSSRRHWQHWHRRWARRHVVNVV
jgi:hypothetical protein